jgi:hypothetical protein
LPASESGKQWAWKSITICVLRLFMEQFTITFYYRNRCLSTCGLP